MGAYFKFISKVFHHFQAYSDKTYANVLYPEPKVLTRNEAAIKIQRAFRKSAESKNKKEIVMCPQNVKNKERVLHKFVPPSIKTKLLGIPKEYLSEDSLFDRDIDAILIFGGIDPYLPYGIGRNTGKDIFKFIPYTNTWEFVGKIPEPRHHHRVQLLKGRIYVVGGADPRVDSKNDVVNTAWSLDPIKRIWYRESSMLSPRKHFGLVAIHQCLYAIGGQTVDSNVLKSVERFNPVDACWEIQSTMPRKIMKLGCAKYKNQIFVAGGIDEKNNVLDDVLYLEVKSKQWTTIIGGLPSPRHSCRLLATPNALYLIGGATEATPTRGVADIDQWEGRTASWRPITCLAVARHGHVVAPLGTQMIVVGGFSPEYRKALGSVECYCLSRETWVRGIVGLPMSLVGHDAVTLPPAIFMQSC